MKFILLAIVILPTFLRAQQDSITTKAVYPSDMLEFNTVEELLSFDLENLKEFSDARGIAFWGYCFAFKHAGKWRLLYSDLFNINTGAGLEFKGMDTCNINKRGRPEMIIRYTSKEYGNRGGTDYEYIQIWDLSRPALILEAMTKEHFAWFSKAEGEQLNQREITYQRGQIKVGEWETIVGEETVPKSNIGPGIYQWKEGRYVRVE